MLTKIDYANLVNIVARGTYNGIQEASAGLILFQKLQTLSQDEVKEVAASGGDNSKNDA